MQNRMPAGDFTQLATMYTKYRPAYSETVLDSILGIIKKPVNELDFVDVGAGTGIWTRMVANRGWNKVTAIEPNDAMRQEGEAFNLPTIQWKTGSAETTHLPNNSADLLSMASSFHWADFDIATKEFHRVLKPQGYFLMLWNPRYLNDSPLLQEIEQQITLLQPNIRRISSGKSTHIETLAQKLSSCDLFEDMIHLEGLHTATLTKDQYLGAWKSVNDVRSQLGEEKFQQFLDFISEKITTPTIDCKYQTRAWIVRKK